jgi:hypothetical protein
VNWVADVAVPPGVVTLIGAATGVEGRVTTVIRVGPVTVTVEAGVPPKLTTLARVRSIPTIVTVVPPVPGPLVGVNDLMAGAPT